jgi:hypothetical protein
VTTVAGVGAITAHGIAAISASGGAGVSDRYRINIIQRIEDKAVPASVAGPITAVATATPKSSIATATAAAAKSIAAILAEFVRAGGITAVASIPAIAAVAAAAAIAAESIAAFATKRIRVGESDAGQIRFGRNDQSITAGPTRAAATGTAISGVPAVTATTTTAAEDPEKNRWQNLACWSGEVAWTNVRAIAAVPASATFAAVAPGSAGSGAAITADVTP